MLLRNPEWLVALVLVPALLVGAVLATRFRGRAWRNLVAERLTPALLRVANPIPRWLALAALTGALVCLIVSLARPQGDTGVRTEKVSGRNLIIALDLSHSMSVTDVSPSRLDQGKTIAFELFESLPDDRIGVIAFAGTPYLVAPLTVDHAAVRETVQQLDTTTIPAGGSDLAAAVNLATKTCRDSGYRNSALVIISDGEDHEGGLADAADNASRAGILTFTIGIGTEDGDFIPDPKQPDGRFRDRNNDTVVSSLQQESLRTLARETGGRYIHAASGTAIGPIIDSAIADLARFEVKSRTRTIAVEFFQWLLMPAVLLLMASIIAGTNWRWVPGPAAATALALAAVLPPARLHADPSDSTFSRLAENSSGEARTRYRLAEGTEALSKRDHHAARSALSEALLSDDPAVQSAAHHNLANSLLAAGWESLSDGEPFPNDEKAPAELRRHVIGKLTEWMEEQSEGDSLSGGYRLFESVLLDWTDAVAHYDSALLDNPAAETSAHNRKLAARLLELLRDTLEQSLQQQQQMMPSPESGEQGDSEQPSDPQQEPGDSDDPQGDQPQPGPGGEDQADENQGSNDDTGDQPDSGDANDDEPKKSDRPPLENESPEEQARRLLRDNADFEQGPLIRSRRRQFERRNKDW